jgi:hypothetical protein
MDLTKRTPQELKNLLANNERHGQKDAVVAVVQEMARRGIANKSHFRHLTWNQDRVAEVLSPFKQVASTVIGNERVNYTQAGGLKIGRSKNDPDWMWIDSYCGIKTSSINAIFVCYVKRVGDEPLFQLRIKEGVEQSFNADGLEEALEQWKEIAARANP